MNEQWSGEREDNGAPTPHDIVIGERILRAIDVNPEIITAKPAKPCTHGTREQIPVLFVHERDDSPGILHKQSVAARFNPNGRT